MLYFLRINLWIGVDNSFFQWIILGIIFTLFNYLKMVVIYSQLFPSLLNNFSTGFMGYFSISVNTFLTYPLLSTRLLLLL